LGEYVARCCHSNELDREGAIMRRHWPQLILILLCAMLATPATAQQAGFGASAATSGVQWQQDLEAAKKLARETNRMVLVHFWTPSCGPCLTLDQTVFNQSSVAAALETRFVPVKLNANENSATAQGFGITRVPTDVVLTPEGQVVGKIISPPTPAGYVAEVTQVAAKYSAEPGQAFANAAANAPMPSQLNAAYAGLQIPVTAQPALAQPSMAPAPETIESPFARGSAAGIGPGAIAGQQNNPFLAAAGSGASAISPATTTSNAAITNRYADAGVGATPAAMSSQAAIAPSVGFAPPAVSAPSQAMANSYFGTAAATGSPPELQTTAQPTLGPPQLQSAGPHQAASNLITPVGGSTATPQLPAGSPPIGFDGYCPVSMRNNWKWVPGDPRWGIVHRGRTYWFASEAEQKQFWTDPDRYSPALSGMDPVMAIDHKQQVPGKREHSIDYDNLFYMFSSEATLAQFTANPERYAVGVRQAMGIPRGRLVR
jgi:protein disulfide-isomerase